MTQNSNTSMNTRQAPGTGERLLFAFAHASADTVFRLSPDFTRLQYLQGDEFATGAYQPDTWLDEFILAEDRPQVAARIREAMRSKSQFEMEHRAYRADGSLGWYLSRIVPLLDDDGAITEWVGTASDITARKRREQDAVFVDEIMRMLVGLTDLDSTMATVAERIGQYLELSHCLLVELDEPEQSITARHGWQRADLPSLFNIYQLADYLAPEVERAWQRGETVVVHDVFADPRANGANCATLHFGAMISVPLQHKGHWQFLLTIYNETPRDWNEHEIALIQDLAERIWTALERARAEQALSISEAKYHALFDSMDQGYCIIE